MDSFKLADTLAFNLTQAKVHCRRKFKLPDLNTKLKLLGVDVASFGDFFAERDGPIETPPRMHAKKEKVSLVGGNEPIPYKDPFQSVYKKYLFSSNGKYLLDGMMIGDTKDCVKLVPLVKKQNALDLVN